MEPPEALIFSPLLQRSEGCASPTTRKDASLLRRSAFEQREWRRLQAVTGKKRAPPVVLGGKFFAQQHGGVAHALLDDPRAFDHAWNQLQSQVPPFVVRLRVPRQEPAASIMKHIP